jgi:tRNA pseudouridine55 synthase
MPLVDGLLLVDKPAGITSHDVVSRVRRAQRTRRVGHAGTLDPFATGLLVCAVGQATRLLPYVDGEPKVYRARVHFGTATNTDDRTGDVVARGGPPDFTRLPSAIASLTGRLAQLPPAFSAKHVDGERAYARARRGEEVTLKPVSIEVFGWREHGRGDDWLDVEITCSGGTYVRALARDLGVALGTVAHCAELRRLASGPLTVANAVPLDALAPGAMLPVRSPLEAMPQLARAVVTEAQVADLRLGRTVPAEADGSWAALVHGDDQRIVAIGERLARADGAVWQPRVVLPPAEAHA